MNIPLALPKPGTTYPGLVAQLQKAGRELIGLPIDVQRSFGGVQLEQHIQNIVRGLLQESFEEDRFIKITLHLNAEAYHLGIELEVETREGIMIPLLNAFHEYYDVT